MFFMLLVSFILFYNCCFARNNKRTNNIISQSVSQSINQSINIILKLENKMTAG